MEHPDQPERQRATIEVSLTDLLGCLRLQPVGDGLSEGSNLDIGYHRVFGGQLLAQIITAASATVPDKAVKSLSVLFPREGDAQRPVRYRCTVHQKARTFATVEVVASQAPEERVIAVAVVSLHAEEAGLHHTVEPPPVGSPAEAPAQALDMIPWQVRIVGDVRLADRSVGPATLQWWMRAEELEALREDGATGPATGGVVDQALLAYASDLTLIGTALRPIEGVSQADSTVTLATAVTSHSIWFHRPFRVDRWLLVSQEAPVMTGGRAFGRGDVFSGSELVASFAQEAMVRVIAPPPPV